MRVENATDVKNHFGQMIDAALREPLVIQRSGRNTAVMMSYEEYEEMTAAIDKIWGERAKKAEKSGYIGAKASQKLINKILHAND